MLRSIAERIRTGGCRGKANEQRLLRKGKERYDQVF
jgi:hypothetical protein